MATEQDAVEHARIKSLRDAVQIGVDDLDAGRYRTFDSPRQLRRHLEAIADSVLESFRTRERKQAPSHSESV